MGHAQAQWVSVAHYQSTLLQVLSPLRLCRGDGRRQVSRKYDRDAVEVRAFDQRSILQAISVSLSLQLCTQTGTC